ncbi:MAG: hypothetical protein GWM98_04030 [Nitrospinaceae bacterium]|nr:hypothetical protein [Nitrospinaceae bacterium]NIR53825.1 hypothetical protein [Nitrospinaceae bacterium]NIS84236.1 hypothetical protein [Nitrospinaceae bacterium]NIU43331.1 hypothetical protein [Nitrospinaceae bacterium]NIU95446.1 hypothetical protein [Nitrospinaceae bacterium]
MSVILVVGVLSALVMPTLFKANVNLATATQIIESDLRFVQELAMSRNPTAGAPIGITFSTGSLSYTITDPLGAFTTTRNLSSDITVTAGGTIAFNKYGEPETVSTVTIATSAGSKSITVEAFSGRVIVS